MSETTTLFSHVTMTPGGLECNTGFHLQGRQGESFLQQTRTLLPRYIHQRTHTPATNYMYDICTPSIQPRPTTYNLIKSSSHVSNHQPTHTCMVNLHVHTHHNTAIASIRHHHTKDSQGNWPSSRGSTNRAFYCTIAKATHSF